jgi:predicted RNA binding protein YcfA (HicA-like mRNA interferase family)
MANIKEAIELYLEPLCRRTGCALQPRNPHDVRRSECLSYRGGRLSRRNVLCWPVAWNFLRSKGSHRIYGKGSLRVTAPFHSGAGLLPKIVKQVLEIIETAGQSRPRAA